MKALLLTLGMLMVLSGCKNSTGPSSAPAQSTSRSVYDSICMVEAWDVEITLTIDGSPSNVMADGSVQWNHQIRMVSSGEGTFDPNPAGPYTPGVRFWRMIHGQVNASINNETFSVSSGTSTRETLIGSSVLPIETVISSSYTLDSYTLDLSSPNGYKIKIPEVEIQAASTLYEPNEPAKIFDGPNMNTHAITGAELANLPYPAKGTSLTGTKTLQKLVFGASGDAVTIDVIVTWVITPGIALAPLSRGCPGL